MKNPSCFGENGLSHLQASRGAVSESEDRTTSEDAALRRVELGRWHRVTLCSFNPQADR